MNKFTILLSAVLVASCSQKNNIDFSINEVSKSYLNIEYINSPLGEEKNGKIDTDPLFRIDGFDCLTFVETTIAKNKSQSNYPNKIEKELNKIRYKNGEISFTNRNHFTSIDWLPNNENILENITDKVFSKSTKTNTIINKKEWFLKTHNIKVLAEDKISTLTYMPIRELTKENIKNIPHESIILIVRPNWNLKEKIGTNLDVSHLGFAIKKDNSIIFRHASKTYQKTIEEDLYTYLKQYEDSKTIKGFSIIKIIN